MPSGPAGAETHTHPPCVRARPLPHTASSILSPHASTSVPSPAPAPIPGPLGLYFPVPSSPGTQSPQPRTKPLGCSTHPKPCCCSVTGSSATCSFPNRPGQAGTVPLQSPSPQLELSPLLMTGSCSGRSPQGTSPSLCHPPGCPCSPSALGAHSPLPRCPWAPQSTLLTKAPRSWGAPSTPHITSILTQTLLLPQGHHRQA